LVRVSNRVPRAHDFGKQVPLGAVPQSDALAHAAIERAKILLHLSKIGEQVARELCHLGKPLLDRSVVQQRDVAGLHARDLGIDLIAALVQLGEAYGRVRLAAFGQLLEQAEQSEEPGFRAHEAALMQGLQPGNGFFCRRREVEMWIVAPWGIELAQPAACRVRPVGQIFQGRFRIGVRPGAGTHGK